MNFEFMTIDTPLPPYAISHLTGFPVSGTAKMYWDAGRFPVPVCLLPVTAIATVLSKVKRSLNELETAGLIMLRMGRTKPVCYC